jgi:hypothetical protein
MLRFFSLIIGEDYINVKNATPNSRKKISALASVIFIPVIIWFFNCYFLVTKILESTIINGLLAGIFMASVIFLIERSIAMAPNNIFNVSFRVFLGLVISVLGAIVLDEIVFKEDIEQQMAELKSENINKHLGKIDAINNAQIIRLQSEADRKYADWQIALDDAKKEADGTGGSGTKGVHAIALMKMSIADSKLTTYHNAKAELQNLQEQISQNKAETTELVDKSMKESALLNRIKALFHLVKGDGYMMVIYSLFTLFVVLLEFMVVILKTTWPKTAYEKQQEFIEELCEKKINRIRQNKVNINDIDKTYPGYNQTAEYLRNQNNPSFFN